MKVRQGISLVLAAALILAPGCVSHSVAHQFNGLNGPSGKQVVHVNTSAWALNFLLTQPLVGNASLDAVVGELTTELTQQQATNVRIVQSGSSSLWWIFFPLSLIVTPVYTEVAADGDLR